MVEVGPGHHPAGKERFKAEMTQLPVKDCGGFPEGKCVIKPTMGQGIQQVLRIDGRVDEIESGDLLMAPHTC